MLPKVGCSARKPFEARVSCPNTHTSSEDVHLQKSSPIKPTIKEIINHQTDNKSLALARKKVKPKRFNLNSVQKYMFMDFDVNWIDQCDRISKLKFQFIAIKIHAHLRRAPNNKSLIMS